MKKILVTGGAGTVGYQVVRFLLSEGKYEITVLELRNRRAYSKLKKFKKRINIVYGDVNDDALIDALIKENEIVIHLAGILPPLANVNGELCKVVDLGGTTNIVNSIKNYNPSCHLLYASSTSIYGEQKDQLNIKVTSKPNFDEFDNYSKYKLECEKYIKDNIKNYTIFRLSYVLGDPGKDNIIYNVKLDQEEEMLSSVDAGYAFVSSIDHLDKLNKKTFDVSGGPKFRTTFADFINHIFKTYGLSSEYLEMFFVAEKNYYGGYYSDSDKLNDILNYRSKNLDVYYDSLNKYKYNIFRFIPRLLSIPFRKKSKKK